MSIQEKYLRFLDDIHKKGAKAVLCAVSKQQPLEKMKALYEVGCRDFAENRPLELKEKRDFFLSKGISDIRWHFIGHIQSRQIPLILASSDLIHSVHNADVLFLLEKRAKAANLKRSILLQVNVSGEASKQGFTKEDVLALARQLSLLENINPSGVMTMAPEGASKEKLCEIFCTTKELARKLHEFIPTCLECSMGMSQDFSEALKAGSTLLRIGSKLFID